MFPDRPTTWALVAVAALAVGAGCGKRNDGPYIHFPDAYFGEDDTDVFVPEMDAADADADADTDAEPEPDVDAGHDTDVAIDADAAPDADAGDDADTPDGDPTTDASDADADAPGCGDGVQDDTEACDDGNLADGDGCAADCTVERCGDGRVTPELGESCDTAAGPPLCSDWGLAGDSARCDDTTCQIDLSDCSIGTCGDGIVDDDEGCDDGGRTSGDGCNAWCRVERCLPGEDADGDGIDNCDDQELCDGIDNDGDGLVDEAPNDATLGDPCLAPDDVGTGGVGACAAGALACVNGELACAGAVAPRDELCNDIDDDCDGGPTDDERALGCDTTVLAGAPATARRFEVVARTAPGDVAVLADRTGSMQSVLSALATELPAVATVADGWGLASFADLDIDGFGAPLVPAWTLDQRVTSGVTRAASALDQVRAVDGGDRPEGVLPALAHLLTGAAITWDAGSAPSPTPAVIATREGGDVDRWVIALEAGDALSVEVFARRERSGLDAVVTIISPTGIPFALNDDAFGLDPAVRITANRTGDWIIRVSACCGVDVPWGTSTGWYAMEVARNGRPQLAVDTSGICVDDDTDVQLVDAAVAWPYDRARCESTCAATGAPAARVAAFCGDGRPWTQCGDGVVGFGEGCDGEGCDATCGRSGAIAAFNPQAEQVLAAGHGSIGGVGFRAGVVHDVLLATDAPWHSVAAYLAEADVFGLLDESALLEAFRATDTQLSGLYAGAVDDEGWAQLVSLASATGALAPTCAFDGARPLSCDLDSCCVGAAGAGVAPGADGLCPLVFALSPDGADVDEVLERWRTARARVPTGASLVVDTSEWPACATITARIDEVATRPCAATPLLLDVDADGAFDRVERLDADAVVTLAADVDASACDPTETGSATLTLAPDRAGVTAAPIHLTLQSTP